MRSVNPAAGPEHRACAEAGVSQERGCVPPIRHKQGPPVPDGAPRRCCRNPEQPQARTSTNRNTALPPNGGLELIAKVLQIAPETRILTVSVDDQQAAIAALRAGAVGHISKDIDPDELARLVVRAAEGEAIVPQRIIMPLLELVREVPDAGWRPLHSRLTTREWEIVELLAEGATTQRIAEHLVLSPTTVYSHVKSVLRKLGVHSRSDAVAAAECLRREEALGANPPQSCPSKFLRRAEAARAN